METKPLTDAEIDRVWLDVMHARLLSGIGLAELRREYARAIERAHGIGVGK
jgi:hypothetical protein